jgi:cytochrome P450
MQFMIDVAPRKNWTTDQMLGQILAVWVPSVHQISMVTTFALEDLCAHSEYVQPLREELSSQLWDDVSNPRDIEMLPLLDSFLRESIRLTNTDPVVMRRKAIEPHVFADGSRIAKGDWVVVPQQAIMRDARKYCNPETFDGFRFARANELLRHGKLSPDTPDKVETMLRDATLDWSTWGMDPAAW